MTESQSISTTPVQDELAPYATEYLVSMLGQPGPYRITRYDNHHYFIPNRKWVVSWQGEYYLCNGKLEYKRYSVFDSAEEALEALRRSDV